MSERDGNRGLTRGGLLKAGALAALAAGTGGAGAALAGAAAGTGAAASGSGRPGRGPAYLSHATYAPLVGTDFHLHRAARRSLRVRLIEARRNERSVGDSFSLLFRAH